MAALTKKTHHKRVQALVRFMRQQKVGSFSVDGIQVTFTPEAFIDDEPQRTATRKAHGPMDRYASDDEMMEGDL